MHVGAIRKLLNGLCVCTGDYPLAKQRGLSSRTDARTIHVQLIIEWFVRMAGR